MMDKIGRSGKLKPPSNLSPQDYMKWREAAAKKYGMQVFAMLGIELPPEFEEIPPHEQDLLDERVNEYLDTLFVADKSRAEDKLSKVDFVTEEQWKRIAEGKYEHENSYFVSFEGKGYLIEFVRTNPDIFLHLFCQIVTVYPNKEVFDDLVTIMKPMVPSYWRVELSFVPTAVPYYEKCKDGQGSALSSYCVKFVEVTEQPGAHHCINAVLRKILDKFEMPTHMI